jgi:hypothetical protein
MTMTSAPSTARPPATPSTPASPGAPDDPPKKRSFQLLAGAQLALSQNQGQALTAAFTLGDQMNINLGTSGVYSFFLTAKKYGI